MPADEKSLYLTFDDGPTSGHTQWILDTLKSHEAKATFFCIGKNIRKNRGLFDEILKAGHEVGNHSDQHIHNWKCSVKQISDDFAECQKLHPFAMYRPPYGEVGRKSLKAIPNKKFILWDVLSEDYREDKSGEDCFKKVINEASAGSIIV
ncbi:MAG TPA: polysaccharide deacetylase family protein, partial [Flavobacteriales bacterium]|nr:polysaccharide deacetylase family protein [Flavobacteriales bacterium]